MAESNSSFMSTGTSNLSVSFVQIKATIDQDAAEMAFVAYAFACFASEDQLKGQWLYA